jgi:hypothetical protein
MIMSKSFSLDQVYRDARLVLMHLRPDEINKISPRSKVVDVAKDVLGDYVSGDPDQILALLCQVYPIHKPHRKTSSRQLVETGRVLTYDRMMRIAADRAMVHPVQIGLDNTTKPRSD